MIQTTGLVEVVLYVENMSCMMSFYRDVIGLNVVYPQNVKDYSKESLVTLSAGPCEISLHRGGKRGSAEDTPKIVFGVRDIEGARGTLLQREVRVGDIRIDSPGVWAFDGLDPEGNPFSIQYHEQAMAVPAGSPIE